MTCPFIWRHKRLDQWLPGHDLAHHDKLLEDIGLLGLLQHDAVGVTHKLAGGGVRTGVVCDAGQEAIHVIAVVGGAQLAWVCLIGCRWRRLLYSLQSG